MGIFYTRRRRMASPPIGKYAKSHVRAAHFANQTHTSIRSARKCGISGSSWAAASLLGRAICTHHIGTVRTAQAINVAIISAAAPSSGKIPNTQTLSHLANIPWRIYNQCAVPVQMCKSCAINQSYFGRALRRTSPNRRRRIAKMPSLRLISNQLGANTRVCCWCAQQQCAAGSYMHE